MAGFSLVGFTLGGVVYAMLGHYLPGVFQSRPVDFTRLLVYLNLDTNALLGTSLQIGVIVIVPSSCSDRCSGAAAARSSSPTSRAPGWAATAAAPRKSRWSARRSSA